MSEDKKDKIIYGLIIAVFLLLANFLYSKDVTGLFNKSEQIKVNSTKELRKSLKKNSIRKFIFQVKLKILEFMRLKMEKDLRI